MVYNRESVWFHLYTAYERMVRERAFPGLDVEEAFARNTDGAECPISRCYPAGELHRDVPAAGFEAEFVGGYLSRQELRSLEQSWARRSRTTGSPASTGISCARLSFDAAGLPMYDGYHAGIGGVYRLRKPAGSMGTPLSSQPDARDEQTEYSTSEGRGPRCTGNAGLLGRAVWLLAGPPGGRDRRLGREPGPLRRRLPRASIRICCRTCPSRPRWRARCWRSASATGR